MDWLFPIEHLRDLWNQHRHKPLPPAHADTDLRYTQGACYAADASDMVGDGGYVTKSYLDFKLAAVGTLFPKSFQMITANPVVVKMSDQVGLDSLHSGLTADPTDVRWFFQAWFTGIPDPKVWGTEVPHNFVG